MTEVVASPTRAIIPPARGPVQSAPAHADQFAHALANAAPPAPAPAPVPPRGVVQPRGRTGEREADAHKRAGPDTPPVLALAFQAALAFPAVQPRGEGEGEPGKAAQPPLPTLAAGEGGAIDSAASANTAIGPAPTASGDAVTQSAAIAASAASTPDLKLTVAEAGALVARIAVRVDAGGAMEIVIEAASAGALPVLRAGAALLTRRLVQSACGDARIVIEHKGEAGV